MDPIWTQLHRNQANREEYTLSQIEIHASDHCVQKCTHCSHAADIAPVRNYDPSEYEPHLKNLQDHGIHWRNINILGGEPFLNPNLAKLAQMCKSYGNNVGIMTNLYWLQDEISSEEHHDTLTSTDTLYYTLYHTLLKKNGGIHYVKTLIHDLKRDYPNLTVRPLGRQGPVNTFARIEFNKTTQPITNRNCKFRQCKQLLHTGIILGCCAARRIPDWPEIDKYDITGDFDPKELAKWYNRPVLDLCHHCNIATNGLTFSPWTTQTATTPPNPDAQDHTLE